MQMHKRVGVVALCVLAVALAGCGKKGDQKQSSQSPQPGQAAAGDAAPDFAKMAEQNRQALAEMNQGKVIEAVSGATLKELLPAELPGMKRASASGERTQSMGVDVSNAEGRYEATDGQGAHVTIKFTDVGNMSGQMRLGMASWAMTQYSRESDTGYEKTSTFNGYKAFEKYDTQNKEGTVSVWVADRFIVEVAGDGVTMDTLKQMLGKVDFKKLAAAGS